MKNLLENLKSMTVMAMALSFFLAFSMSSCSPSQEGGEDTETVDEAEMESEEAHDHADGHDHGEGDEHPSGEHPSGDGEEHPSDSDSTAAEGEDMEEVEEEEGSSED